MNVMSYHFCQSELLSHLQYSTTAPNQPPFSEGKNICRASLIAQLVKDPLATQETLVQFLSREDLLEKE